MVKKELEQEAEELYNDWYAHKLGAISIIDVICKMAEPRERKIAEATKIIKDLLDTQYRLDPYRDIFKDRIAAAEQFISEVEK